MAYIAASRRLVSSIIAVFLVCMPAESEWFHDAGNRWDHISQTACEVMTSGITKWFTKDGPYSFGGNPATAKMYAVINSDDARSILGGKSAGYQIIQTHSLSNSDGATLSKSYSAVADAGVPFFLQVVPLPAQVGTAMSLLDWAVKNGAKQSKASEIAALMPSGGLLENGFTLANKAGNYWLTRQIWYKVSVNDRARNYLVCTWTYPVAIK